MPTFSANLSWLYQDLDFFDRFEAAARDGFRGVEYQAPYHAPKEKIAEHLREHGLTQALFNLPAGNWAGGERGIAGLPAREQEFRDGIAVAIEYAIALECGQVNCLSGIAPLGADPAELDAVLVGNLQYAASRLADAGIKLLIEPVNTVDVPGFLVSTVLQAERLIQNVGHDNLFIQFDVYHAQVMSGDLTRTLDRLGSRVAHVQIADNPGRHEPGTGEINYAFLLSHLDRTGYAGWVGCEYRPLASTTAGLTWMRAYL